MTTIKNNIVFSATGVVGGNVVSVVMTIILARLLSPDDFGIMAIIGIISAFSTVIASTGMGAAIIHNNNLTDRHCSTAFWINVIIALILVLGIFSASNNIALFFDNSRLSDIVSVTIWLLLVNAAFVVPIALLQKQGNFKSIAMIELISVVIAGVVAVAMAINGFGVLSLVANLLVRDIIKLVMLYRNAKWFPKLEYGVDETKELFGYSGFLVLSAIFNQVTEKLDVLLVGKYLGVNALGVYDYANRIAVMPPTVIGRSINRVLFSSYSAKQDDLAYIRNIYLKVMKILVATMFPVMIFLSFEAEDLVLGVLGGERWSGMILPLQILAVVFMLRIVAVLNSPVYMALGKNKLALIVTIGMRGNVIVMMVVGLQYGMIGLLLGLLCARIVNMIPVFYFPGKLIDINWWDVFNSLKPVFMLVAFFVIVLLAMNHLTNRLDNHLLELFLVGSVSFSIYIMMLRVVSPDIIVAASSILWKQKREGLSG